MQKKEHTFPTERITNSIEKLISKNGLEKTADFLETVSLTNSLQFSEVYINLQKFILAETIKQFRISPSAFDTSKAPVYKKARATCFYLYYTYCNLTGNKILSKHKKFFGTRRRIDYAITSVVELIAVPAIDKEHHSLHKKIEEKVKEFIASSKK